MSKTAHALGAFLGCEHEHGIAYRAVMEWTGPEAVAAAVAAGAKAGMLCDYPDPAHSDCYAVLDLVDEQGDEIGDHCIRDRAAFEWWRRAVELRATSSDCRICEPAAYAATYAAV